MTRTMLEEDLLKATKSATQRELARKLGVSQNCVWRWFRVGHVSADGAIAIERLTKGKIAAVKLRREYVTSVNHRRADSGTGKKPQSTEAAGT